MRFNSVYALVLWASIAGLLSHNAFAQKTTVKGKLTDPQGQNIVLYNLVTSTEVGTAKLDNKGKFELEFNLDKADFYALKIDDENENSMLLVLEPKEKVEIEALGDFSEPIIKGSPGTSFIYTLQNDMTGFEQKLEDLQKQIDKERKEYLRQKLTDNSQSLAALVYLDEFDINEDFAFYEQIINSLKAKYPENDFVNEFAGKLDDAKKTAIGSPAPEISLPDTTGTVITLSSLKGKVVLIDFWASWCMPCLAEMPSVIAMYDEYKSKGFEIYGVSLDAEEADWKDALNEYQMAWPNVSDLQYWYSPAVTDYGVDAIPYTVLLDKNGNIVAKNLRGDELKEKVAEMLK